MIIYSFLKEMSHFPKLAYPVLKVFLDEMIARYGEDAVALMIQNAAASGLKMTYEIAYDEQELRQFMYDMMEFLDLGAFERDYVEEQISGGAYFQENELLNSLF